MEEVPDCAVEAPSEGGVHQSGIHFLTNQEQLHLLISYLHIY